MENGQYNADTQQITPHSGNLSTHHMISSTSAGFDSFHLRYDSFQVLTVNNLAITY